MRRALFAKLVLVILAAVVAMMVVPLVVRSRGPIPVAALIVALAAVIAAGILTRNIARPMKDLSAAFRRFGAGDFDARVLPARRGELRELGDGFNDMAFRTKAMVEELTAQREALNAIIGSIREGLMVVDSTGRVVLANDSFGAIAGAAPATGRFYWEVIREPELVDLLKSAAAGSPVSGRVETGGRVFESNAALLPATGRTVLTLHDITEVASTADLKRDLVTSVSHELRTPLTAIKGYVETLEESARPEDRRYLETIHRNTDRLISLVGDLLTLSALEDKGDRLELADVDAVGLARSVVAMFERAAAKRGLKLALVAEEGLPSVRADAFKLEQVLINLLDNAVKYTDTGSITLTLGSAPSALDAGHSSLVITVADTGSGIAREHLPRIFERFYVADKSRSRQLGGTGLGLAIAKHIVQLHGGEIAVESTPGVGTTFTVTLSA
jgi:two-component system phosphate regulon sensor histidine kinase PhoR